jgi:heme/copper-type cytochrome/quinol oxidase subunit 4
MNKFVKYLLIILGLDVILAILAFSFVALCFNRSSSGVLEFGFYVILICFVIQIITGLVFLANEEKRDIGKALLLSLGIIILIGYSICSSL